MWRNWKKNHQVDKVKQGDQPDQVDKVDQVYLVNRVAWPSGLRRWFKAPVSSEAWVRIPPLPDIFSLFVFNCLGLPRQIWQRFLPQSALLNENRLIGCPAYWGKGRMWWNLGHRGTGQAKEKLLIRRQERLNGLGVWFSLWVREVPGSNPGWAHDFYP